jgi:hypothetical protein
MGCGGTSDDDFGEERVFLVTVENITKPRALRPTDGAEAVDVLLAPGVFAVGGTEARLFDVGERATPALERLAEDGDNSGLLAQVREAKPHASGVFGADDDGVSYAESPIGPGMEVSFVFAVRRGMRLYLTAMFVQSNDVFVTLAQGLDPFDRPAPNVTDQLVFMDAGTERNEPFGSGVHQAPRQDSLDSGEAEGGVVHLLEEPAPLPLPDLLKVTVEPSGAALP